MSNNDKYLLRLYLNDLQNRIFTFKNKVNFECQMASVGTWSHSGDFSSECENVWVGTIVREDAHVHISRKCIAVKVLGI